MSDQGLPKLERMVARELTLIDYPPEPWLRRHGNNAGTTASDVVIVGAGMCGLAAAFALKRLGIANIRVIDQATPGREGPWTTFARMRTLRSPKQLVGPAMDVPGLTFRSWYEAQHGAAAWAALDKIPTCLWMDYLTWFRHVLALPVENGIKLRHVRPDGDLLALDVEGPAGRRILKASKLVLATGRDGLGGPHVPALFDDLPRDRWCHSSQAIDFTALAGKQVAVLGGGASAWDNAAEVLEAGAAAVTMHIRATGLPRVNKAKSLSYPGFVVSFPHMDDHWRWRQLLIVLRALIPPPVESLKRVSHFSNFDLLTESPWLRLGVDDNAVVIKTPSQRHRADFVIAATGFETDLSRRPEIADFYDSIALWRDRFRPPAGQESIVLARHPYLAEGFAFVEKVPGTAPFLRDIHAFNFAATLSLGFVSGDIPNISQGAQWLAEAIARDLFIREHDDHEQALADFDTEDFAGDEWRPAGGKMSD